MTQNTNPTLTEDEIYIHDEYEDMQNGQSFHNFIVVVNSEKIKTEKDALEVRQKILTALNEYPKLKEIEIQYNEILTMALEVRKRTKCPESHNLLYWLEQENNKLLQFKQRLGQFLKKKYDQYVDVRCTKATEIWKLLEELSEILKGDQ